ncbi:integrase core domain-containing protein, partial [Kitasatospora sp. NPDC050463]|uniref:integrase core domain-containing protein n=1 Tax=Kitasatospora sp. NPDC050463 TaxID=3155786 RepID=UPI0033EEFDF1
PSSTRTPTTSQLQNHRSQPQAEVSIEPGAVHNGLCDRLGVVQSMGRMGSALDNAAESFNSLIKVDYIHRQHFSTRDQARIKIATWITDFYNTRRRHTLAADHPPVEVERIISKARTEHLQQDRTA